MFFGKVTSLLNIVELTCVCCPFIVDCCLCFQFNTSTDAAPIETAVVVPFEHPPDAPGSDDRRTGQWFT